MDPFRYRIITEWSDEDAAFIARVPALPGCAAHGDSADQASREAEVAARGVLEVMTEQGKPLPDEDASADYSGNIRIRMPRSLHHKLTQIAEAEEVSLNQLMIAALQAYVEGRRALALDLSAVVTELRQLAVQARQTNPRRAKTLLPAPEPARAAPARSASKRARPALREPAGAIYAAKKPSSAKHKPATKSAT